MPSYNRKITRLRVSDLFFLVPDINLVSGKSGLYYMWLITSVHNDIGLPFFFTCCSSIKLPCVVGEKKNNFKNIYKLVN
jgi:hypothetical protein